MQVILYKDTYSKLIYEGNDEADFDNISKTIANNIWTISEPRWFSTNDAFFLKEWRMAELMLICLSRAF